LYEFIGAGLYQAFGGQVRAGVAPHADSNSIAGGVLLALVYRLLRRLQVHEGNAAAWTAFMGAAATFWRFSTDADAYILPTVLLVWTYLLLVPQRVPAPVRVGLIHAAGTLPHQISALFYPVALFCLWRQSRERWWLLSRADEYVQDFGRNGGAIWVDWTYLQRSARRWSRSRFARS
jgi:hypothetical protein